MTGRLVVLAALILAGCSGDSDPTRPAKEATAPTATSTSASAASDPSRAGTTEGTCPLTLPNGSFPPGQKPREWNYGNGKLWTSFWPHNLVIVDAGFVQEDGAVRMKWPWWRGVRGDLKVEGRRLDANAPQLTAEIPPYYGTSGFQPTALFFPTEGCWEVTGSVGNAKLTFVTIVVKASTYFLEEKQG